jgi:DNA-binding transcriptional MerR regulator
MPQHNACTNRRRYGSARVLRHDARTPAEIEELLQLWRDRSRQSADVKRIALNHVAGLERKIAELNQMAATLKHLAECCSGDHRPDCPILDGLENALGSTAEHLRGRQLASISASKLNLKG